MTASEKINEVIEAYLEKSEEVLKKSKPSDGLLGFGDDPRRNPCHEQFYGDMGRTVEEICEDDLTEDEAYCAVMTILEAGRKRECPNMCKWMLVACQGHTIPLLSYLSAQSKEKLKKWYDDNVPKRTRLPVEKEVYRAISKY